MDRKENNWFNDITKPTTSSMLGEGTDYLDRLMGGGSSTSRQYFMPTTKKYANKTQNSKVTNTNQQSKQHHNDNSCKKSSFSAKKPTVELDDVKWLEERRKKFPKIDGPKPELKRNMENESSIGTKINPNSKHFISNGKKPSDNDKCLKGNRKKTLFEMLIDTEVEN